MLALGAPPSAGVAKNQSRAATEEQGSKAGAQLLTLQKRAPAYSEMHSDVPVESHQ